MTPMLVRFICDSCEHSSLWPVETCEACGSREIAECWDDARGLPRRMRGDVLPIRGPHGVLAAHGMCDLPS